MTQGTETFACAKSADEPRNRPGLSEIRYGAGTQPQFFDRMLEQVSRDPNLSRLTSRALNDPAVSLVDAWSVVLDILSFYQERIANEGWLRTATSRRSIQELARAVGYDLSPGVSARTYLVPSRFRPARAAATAIRFRRASRSSPFPARESCRKCSRPRPNCRGAPR